eukprot:TRINITY_DN10867_c0_g1_i2.p1 TRINITY_DN10867_c0_g1~~TRINITY_DN10867_c0_g1_i2.p1  ORF type:complete len:434 (-),score=71.35 TRINITY_DN10867_c0_g1_i2:58-1359(-)
MVVAWFCNVRRWKPQASRCLETVVADCLDNLQALLMLLQEPVEELSKGLKNMHELRGVLYEVNCALDTLGGSSLGEAEDVCNPLSIGPLQSTACVLSKEPCSRGDVPLKGCLGQTCSSSTATSSVPGLRLRRRVRPRRPWLRPPAGDGVCGEAVALVLEATAEGASRAAADVAEPASERGVPAEPAAASMATGSSANRLRRPGACMPPPPRQSLAGGRCRTPSPVLYSTGRRTSSTDWCANEWHVDVTAEDFCSTNDMPMASGNRPMCRVSAPGLREMTGSTEDGSITWEQSSTERAVEVEKLRRHLMTLNSHTRHLPPQPPRACTVVGVIAPWLQSLPSEKQSAPAAADAAAGAGAYAAGAHEASTQLPAGADAHTSTVSDDIEEQCELYVRIESGGRIVWTPKVAGGRLGDDNCRWPRQRWLVAPPVNPII